jgi:hypothetical protein
MKRILQIGIAVMLFVVALSAQGTESAADATKEPIKENRAQRLSTNYGAWPHRANS